MNANERCYRTGNYSLECNCNLCSHQKECNGVDLEDDRREEKKFNNTISNSKNKKVL